MLKSAVQLVDDIQGERRQQLRDLARQQGRLASMALPARSADQCIERFHRQDSGGESCLCARQGLALADETHQILENGRALAVNCENVCGHKAYRWSMHVIRRAIDLRITAPSSRSQSFNLLLSLLREP